MTTKPSIDLSDDEQIENLMAPAVNVPGVAGTKATIGQGIEGKAAESSGAEPEPGGATDTFAGMTAENSEFAAMLAEVDQQPSEEIARYVQQAAGHQSRMLGAQQQQQVAALYQAQQQALLQQQQATPQMTMEMEDPEESDDEGNGRSEKRAGRRKIRIEYIEDKSRRHITFSKRKAGIMKKAYELSTLTGTQVLLLVASETGHVYTFATPKLQPLITKPEGKNLIQACLNAPDAEYAHPHAAYDDDIVDDRPMAGMPSNMAAVSQNYAAAMAGLAGYQYPQQAAGNAAAALAQAYMNQAAAHYPYAAAQYNAAAASGYWPQGANTPQGHERSAEAGGAGAEASTPGQETTAQH